MNDIIDGVALLIAIIIISIGAHELVQLYAGS